MQNEDVELGTLIGRGKYREVYSQGDVVWKVLKNSVPLVGIPLRPDFYLRFVYGIEDINRYEFDNYSSINISSNLTDFFNQVFEPKFHHSRYCNSSPSTGISKIVRDSSGSISKPLSQFDQIENEDFWNKLDELESFIIKDDVPLFDISPTNVLVQILGDEMNPVIFDYKRMGIKSYPFQPSLRFQSGRSEKIKRRFKRLRDNYGIC